MQTKTSPDEIESFVSDASFIREGHADRVVLPESVEEVSEILARANRERVPVTVSGAGTGTVGGRVAFGGIVLATDKLNHIKQIVHEERGGFAIVEAGVVLSDLQRAVDQEGLLYPPDPTERGCFVGGNVATNASGARTFKYGPTRNYVRRLKVVLASGEYSICDAAKCAPVLKEEYVSANRSKCSCRTIECRPRARTRLDTSSLRKWTRSICLSAVKARSV